MDQNTQMQSMQKGSNNKFILLALGLLAILLVGGIAGVVGYKIGEGKKETKEVDEQQTSSDNDDDDDVAENVDDLDVEEKDTDDNTEVPEGSEVNVNSKELVLEKMGYKLIVPNDWSIKSETLNVNVVHAVLTDGSGNEYHLDTMCQLGDCVCEWQRNKKTLYKVSFLNENIDLAYHECTDEFIQNKLYSEIFFRAYTPNAKYELLGFKLELKDDISYDEAKTKYTYLIDVIESIEVVK